MDHQHETLVQSHCVQAIALHLIDLAVIGWKIIHCNVMFSQALWNKYRPSCQSARSKTSKWTLLPNLVQWNEYRTRSEFYVLSLLWHGWPRGPDSDKRSCFQMKANVIKGFQARIFFRGPAEFWPQRGPEPLICSKQEFSINITWKLHDFEKILGARGAQAPSSPPSASESSGIHKRHTQKTFELLTMVLWQRRHEFPGNSGNLRSFAFSLSSTIWTIAFGCSWSLTPIL